MRRPVTASVICAVVIASSAAFAVEPRPAVGSPAQPAAATASPDPASAAEAAQVEGHRVEDMSSRTEYSQTFANPDGTWTTETTTEPEFVQSDDGTWQRIDTTLTLHDGRLEPRVALADVSLSNGGDSTFADINQDGKDLDWHWPTQLPQPSVNGSTATYADVVPGGGDLVVTATPTGFTHDIVLNSAPPAALNDPTGVVSYTVPVATHGASLDTTRSGAVDISAPSGDVLVTAPAPIAFDAAGAPGDGAAEAPVDVLVGQNAAGTPTMTMQVKSEFLSDPSTVYPVRIDPSYTVSASADTYISQANPSTNYAGQTALSVGDNAGTDVARTFLHFNFDSDNPIAGKTILSATLKLQNFDSNSCAGSQINVNRVTESWAANNLNWNNQPAYTSADTATFNPAYGYSDNCPAGQASWDVTAIVSYWAAHQGENYGLRVKAADESDPHTWRRYRALDSQMDSVLPRLSVTYNSDPDVPTGLSITPSRGDVTASLAPTLRARVTDPDLGQVTAKFRIFDESDQVVKTLDADSPVASGGTATVDVPADLLVPNTSYSFDAQASDGSLSSAYSARSTFRVDPALTIIPAPSCVSPCSPVADQVLVDESIASGASEVVPIRIPGVEQGSVDRIQVTATITDSNATGSLTLADTDYAATDPASFQYGSGQAVTGTAEVFPSYDDDAITATNNGSASVHLHLVLNAWIPVDTTDDATLDAADDSVDDAAAEAAIADDPSDYEDVDGATTITRISPRITAIESVATAEAAPAPVENSWPCPTSDDPDATCGTELTVDNDLTPTEIADAQATMSDAPVSPVTGRPDPVTARAIGPKCFAYAGSWVARNRWTACRLEENTVTNWITQDGVRTVTGVAVYYAQYLIQTNWNSPDVYLSYRMVLKRWEGEGEDLTVTIQAQCLENCESRGYTDGEFEATAASPRTGWQYWTIRGVVGNNAIATPKLAYHEEACASGIMCGRTGSLTTPAYHVVRCDSKSYIQTAEPGCVVSHYTPTLTMSLSGVAPETARHIMDAQNSLSPYHWGRRGAGGTGYPLVRKYWAPGTPNLNRREMRRECRALPGSKSCDEYAFASTRQGCYYFDCDVKRIDLADNAAGGRVLNTRLYRPARVLDGDAYWVSIVQ